VIRKSKPTFDDNSWIEHSQNVKVKKWSKRYVWGWNSWARSRSWLNQGPAMWNRWTCRSGAAPSKQPWQAVLPAAF